MPENNKHSFNHLKIHSQYSICEGALKIEDLKNYCKENKIQSVGLSDTSNLCGALAHLYRAEPWVVGDSDEPRHLHGISTH